MKTKTKIVLWSLAGIAMLVGAGVAGSYMIGSNPLFVAMMGMNHWFGRNNPPGTLQVELRQPALLLPDSAREGDAPALSADDAALEGRAADDDRGEWRSYNRTVASERFSPLAQINSENADQLEVICTYDTKRYESFQSGIMMIDGALIGTTAEDIFSIDAGTCEENWRIHESSGLGTVPNNRGAAYLEGRLFRAYHDGHVRAYDAATGERLWQTYLGQKGKRLWFTAAPIAWDGMVFFGTAGSHGYNNRGRMFGLDAMTGKPIWQAFTVPRQADDVLLAEEASSPADVMRASWENPPGVPITGGGTWTSYTLDPETGHLYVPVGNPAPVYVKTLRPGANLFTNTMLVLDARTGDYVKHYSIMEDDQHDWDVSNPPILYTSRGGRRQLSFHPKDGHLYSFDRATDEQIYRKPVTRVENIDARFAPGRKVHFCPGAVGGGLWSSAAYDPRFNLVFTGQTEWCTTAEIAEDARVLRAKEGDVWFGVASRNPYHIVGIQDPPTKWGGWVYASDADSGDWRWRARSNYPVTSGVTPTAGGIVAFGDKGGNFYVLRASDGERLWSRRFPGGIAGGVITYSVDGHQRVALTSGTFHPMSPVRPSSGRIIVLGLRP
ncbi:PQQ-binding-like beta-propeller repeat protein [Xanthomonas hortorum]|uniref:PQQ-binding-like beta-propeller repeat protein n=1 Tax=Xanthomonas hortorum pv. hederae TaxID=453603 RepID=A0A9X3YYT2_9XANT|nr:PQQ-binding-like beta-propeller repeat protein [Xanthomonas hortorum]MCE4369622.1 PQQ-binding-like beta-propeller repeat protein [Xanthomonas hortorum pv. hederae]MDC8637120.1 PQQ-binding-like beta-propeller repeat protein [Xanthomonas hortorum pv. hederae]PPU86168.1 hypothetical protein XhhCFBP4925_00075 [Xanthomonas hortorum pv. hederae]PUF01232.1 hypothetical protein C7T87_04040 [Xanthomonas hortorum pv. hederae]